MKNFVKYLKRWILHKAAFLIVENRLTGIITFSGIIHDWEKPLLYIITLGDRKKIQKLHRIWARHHVNNGILRDVVGAIIDWESASITKPEAPLNARGTFNKFYPSVPGVDKALRALGL